MFSIRNSLVALVATVAAMIGALAGVPPARADLMVDPTFGVNGIAYTAFGTDNSDTPYDLLIQPDGKILTAGISTSRTTADFFIAMTRHTADGVPDSAGFGPDGKVFTHFLLRDQANAVALQEDGKIVASGMQANSNAVAAQVPSVYRFNSDGSADTTFAGTGFVATRYDGVSSGEHGTVKILPDGRILATGRSHPNASGGQAGFGVKRYLASGASDLSQRINTLFNFSSRGSAAFYDDGRILWVNTGLVGGVFQWVLARGDSSGSLDPTFGILATGVQAPNIPDAPPRARVLADGRILIAGTSVTPAGQQKFTAIRLHSDGTVDSTFGTNGRTDVSFGSFGDECRDMALYPDGRILLAGRSGPLGGQPGLVRLLPDGAPDSTFSGDGMLVVDLNNTMGTHYFTRIIILPDFRMLAAGFDFHSHRGDFFLTRLGGDVSGVETPDTPPVPVFLQVYPNPSRNTAAIRVEMNQADAASVTIFDAAGRLVRTLFNGELPAGSHVFGWDGLGETGAAAPPGVYFTRVATNARIGSRKLVRIR